MPYKFKQADVGASCRTKESLNRMTWFLFGRIVSATVTYFQVGTRNLVFPRFYPCENTRNKDGGCCELRFVRLSF